MLPYRPSKLAIGGIGLVLVAGWIAYSTVGEPAGSESSGDRRNLSTGADPAERPPHRSGTPAGRGSKLRQRTSGDKPKDFDLLVGKLESGSIGDEDYVRLVSICGTTQDFSALIASTPANGSRQMMAIEKGVRAGFSSKELGILYEQLEAGAARTRLVTGLAHAVAQEGGNFQNYVSLLDQLKDGPEVEAAIVQLIREPELKATILAKDWNQLQKYLNGNRGTQLSRILVDQALAGVARKK